MINYRILRYRLAEFCQSGEWFRRDVLFGNGFARLLFAAERQPSLSPAFQGRITHSMLGTEKGVAARHANRSLIPPI